MCLVSGYKPIHRNVVPRRIQRLERDRRATLVQELKSVGTISISTDFWSNKNNRSFIVVTGHYFVRDFELKSQVLDFSSFNHRHTAVRIADVLTRKLAKLGVMHKINRITSDGAMNLVTAIDLLDINTERIWCVAHRLHLVVTNGLALWPKKSKRKNGSTGNVWNKLHRC